jgi:hypothetical protein
VAYHVDLAAEPLHLEPGGSSTLVASITGGPEPMGVLFFQIDGQNVNPPVEVVDSHAVLTHAFAEPGTYEITVQYMGDAVGSGGVSNPVSLIVESPIAVQAASWGQMKAMYH